MENETPNDIKNYLRLPQKHVTKHVWRIFQKLWYVGDGGIVLWLYV